MSVVSHVFVPASATELTTAATVREVAWRRRSWGSIRVIVDEPSSCVAITARVSSSANVASLPNSLTSLLRIARSSPLSSETRSAPFFDQWSRATPGAAVTSPQCACPQ